MQIKNTPSVFLLASVIFLATSVALGEDKVANYSGTWDGNWTSETTAEAEGTFIAKIIQKGSTLTGTLAVPDILEKTNMPLKGSISGNKITFGDVAGVITFKGNITSESELSGKYEYPMLGDYGNWQARKSK